MPNAQFSIERVAQRVKRGGHHIPDDVVRRRYDRGLKNFFNRYATAVDKWHLFDNTEKEPTLIADFSSEFGKNIINNEIWNIIKSQNEST